MLRQIAKLSQQLQAPLCGPVTLLKPGAKTTSPGGGTVTGAPVGIPARGRLEEYVDQSALAAARPTSERTLVVLLNSCPVAPAEGDKAVADGATWRILKVSLEPAAGVAVCRVQAG